MATITPATASSSAPPLITAVASTPAGDVIPVSANNDLFIIFDNGHSSPITVTIGGVASTVNIPDQGEGSFTPTSKTISVVNATARLFYIPRAQIQGYMNGSSQVAITYTSGNAAMTVQAFVR